MWHKNHHQKFIKYCENYKQKKIILFFYKSIFFFKQTVVTLQKQKQKDIIYSYTKEDSRIGEWERERERRALEWIDFIYFFKH